MLSVITLYALFATTYALSKLLLMNASPLCSVAIPMTLGGMFSLFYVRYLYKNIPYKRCDFGFYLQLTIFNVILPYSLRLWSMQYVSSIKAALLFSLSPFLTAFFSYLRLRSSIKKQQMIGLAIGLIGMLPILLTSTGSEVSSLWFLSWAEIGLLISTASISYSLVVLQQLIKERACPVPLANGVSMFFGGIITLGLAFLLESPIITGSIKLACAYGLIQAILIYLGCANWRAYLLKRYSTTFMSFASLLVSPFAAFYGWILFSERLSWNFALSLILMVIGLSVYYLDE